MTVDHGSYVALVSQNESNKTFTSSGDTENAIRVDGSAVTLDSVTVVKNAGAAASGESSNFYGSNAAILAMNKAALTVSNSEITTSATGGNGIFSYGEGTTVTVEKSTIKTSANSSGGVMVTGGGTMIVKNSTIETQGGSSAALRSDRGGGTLTVDGGTYIAHGNGSPAIYSTADITVKNATLTAKGSEAVVVEGKNSVALYNCALTGNMRKDNVENLQNVMLYQSMSGDADVGKSSFTMEGGSLTSENGDMFYVTNTTSDISLTGVSLSLSNGVLLRVAGNDARNGWGTVGKNGGKAALTARSQTLSGAVIVDGISTLTLELTEKSSFTGTINSTGAGGAVSVVLDEDSTWTLTGDSYITSFKGNAQNLVRNGHALYVAGKAL